MTNAHEPSPEARIGQRTRLLREMQGWSQAELARRLAPYGVDLHQTTIAKLEGGSRPIRVNEQHAIADLFGVTPDELVARDPSPAMRELDEALRDVRRHEFALATASEANERAQRDLHVARRAALASKEAVEALAQSRDEALERYVALLAAHDDEVEA